MRSFDPATLERVFARLSGLYSEEIEAGVGSDYISAHANSNSIRRQVEVFGRYAPHLGEAKRVLDWGCNHAPDACMIREAFGAAVELHGCDFTEPDRHPRFHNFAGLSYTRLADPVRLPYPDAGFDVVISSGVLEHAAMDFESLKEIHRVLRHRGRLVVTFLPNRLSYTEWLARTRGFEAHTRLYGRSEALGMLMHHGFRPLMSRYHQFLPAHRLQSLLGPLWPLNRALESLPLTRIFCANLMVVAERVVTF